MLEYDILFGKSYYLKDNEKPQKNKMKMGLDNVTITSLEYNSDFILVKGTNFTENSSVYIDKKKIKTEFIDDQTLKIKSNEKGNTIIVKQLGRNDGLLSQSNTMDLSDDQLAKK